MQEVQKGSYLRGVSGGRLSGGEQKAKKGGLLEREAGGRRVLLLATGMWMSTARLSMALTSLGCVVEIMAERRHPAVLTGVVGQRYEYDPLRPVQSVLEAIRASKPDVVIPTDEVAVQHLEELRQAAEESEGEEELAMRALVERSSGRADVMAIGRSRIALMRLAEAVGVATPAAVPVMSDEDLSGAVKTLGLPLVLKADATFGGRGVRIAASEAAARKAWKSLHRAPTMMDAVRRGVVWKEWMHVRPWARGETRAVAAQKIVRGGERTAMAVTHEGELLAFVCLEVVQATAARGPASSLRVIEDKAMEEAMRRVSRNVGMSGFCGFDFMVEPESGVPLLIEVNLRPTQLAHLSLGPGKDLAAAYVRAFLGADVADRPSVMSGDVIALFPQELQRDAKSALLSEAYHDVPWEQPKLVKWAMKGKVPAVVSSDVRWKGSLARDKG